MHVSTSYMTTAILVARQTAITPLKYLPHCPLLCKAKCKVDFQYIFIFNTQFMNYRTAINLQLVVNIEIF